MNDKIFLDKDGTITNTPFHWLTLINNHYNTSYTVSDIQHYNWLQEQLGYECEYWRNPDFFKDIIPLENSQWFIDELKYIFGKENIYIITWSTPEVEQIKNSILSLYFNIPSSQIIHTSEKWKYTKHNILVDDHLEHVKKHCAYNGNRGILFNLNGEYGWNRQTEINNKILEATTYTEVISRILEIKNMS